MVHAPGQGPRRHGRLTAGLLALAVALSLPVPAFAVLDPVPSGAWAPGSGPDVAAEVLLADHLDALRARTGVPPLTTHLQLVRLAREHAAGMAAADDAGGECGDRRTLRHRAPPSGGLTIAWSEVFENVVCVDGDARAAHDLLIGSDQHRPHLLAADAGSVGIGAWRAADGTLWVAQVFVAGGAPLDLAAVREALRAARATFPDGVASHVVLARSDLFADALAGAALAGADGPVLFTDAATRPEPDPVLRPRVRAEIDRVLPPGGTVFLLGGAEAVSPRAEAELRAAGYRVRRLAGTSRVETAAQVAREVVRRHGAPARVLVAAADDWPDAVTGGVAAAYGGLPLVLTHSHEVPAATSAFLAQLPGAARLVIGGPAAVSEEVRRELGATRLGGTTRAETALTVADALFGPPGDGVVVIDAYAPHGWAASLAWSPFAARTGAPHVVVGSTTPGSVTAWLEARRPRWARFAGSVSDRARAAVADHLVP